MGEPANAMSRRMGELVSVVFHGRVGESASFISRSRAGYDRGEGKGSCSMGGWVATKCHAQGGGWVGYE